jgi:SAM-dependent methyltransferase
VSSPPEGFERRWRERFETWGQTQGSDAAIAGWSESGLLARLANFERLWSSGGKAGRWLDAGCGAGTYVRLLAAHGAEVIGADYSLPSLHKAADRLGDQAVLTASDVRALPFAAASFDGALCFGVMQALADPRPALRELCRVVRPGGEVWIDALNRYSAPHWAAGAWRRVRGKPAHMRYDDPWRLARWLREAGAAQVELHWLPLVPGHWRLVGEIAHSALMRRVLHRAPPLAALASHAVVLRGRIPRAA